jgi:NADH:ubiquinone oxidoreductase subunit 5 (subunit L)/multisubunit Na+/H+ antiporter MnhA subunit
MYLLILLLPLLSFPVAACSGRYIGRNGSVFITTSSIFPTATTPTVAFHEVGIADTNCYVRVATRLDVAAPHASRGFLLDTLTVVMLIVATYIPAPAHPYPADHTAHDPHIQRFMSYLSLSTPSTSIPVTADNFVQMFIGWEGVGLASSLLTNSRTTRLQANKAAMKALIVNRIGDFGLSLGIFAIFFVFGAVDYSTVFATASDPSGSRLISSRVEFDILTLICFFLFIGAVGKSAQIGSHTWLPDAMEGPTPVSALTHAATTVILRSLARRLRRGGGWIIVRRSRTRSYLAV